MYELREPDLDNGRDIKKMLQDIKKIKMAFKIRRRD